VGDITPPNQEGQIMGIFSMSTFVGLSLGPLIGGTVNDRFNLESAFVLMGILSFISFIFSLILLPPVRSEQTLSRAHSSVTWKILIKDREINGLFVFRFMYTACIGIIWGFLPVFADSVFSLSSSSIGVIVMLGVLTSGVLQTPMGYLADRGNKPLMIAVGGIIVVFSLFFFEWAGGFWDLFRASVVFGIGGSLSMAPLMAIAVLKGAQTRAMGAVMALMTMAHSLGMMMGSFLAGILMDCFDMRRIFYHGGLMMLVGVLLYILLCKPRYSGQKPV
jgi:predicted MFS family arabinose efflux permease